MTNSTGPILGVLGVAGAGKDTIADLFVEEYGFAKVSLADPLKRAARDFYAFTDQQLWGASHFRNAGDKRYPRADGTYLSPREVLQRLGTEVGRECYANTWVDLCIRTATKLLTSGSAFQYSQQLGVFENCAAKRDYAGVVVPDVRFKNELAAIKVTGGVAIRIVRPGAGLRGSANLHASEVEQAGIPDSEFDHVVQNAGTIEDLRRVVREIGKRIRPYG